MKYEIENYTGNLSAAKIAVIGIGISNIPLIKFLRDSGAAHITAYDKYDNGIVRSNIAELTAGGYIQGAVTGETYLDEIEHQNYDIIFKAPAIRPDLPQLLRAVQNGALLTSEMELFMQLCPCKIYGVTGSDGKTTTTTLIWKLLATHYANSNTHVWLGGNIGRPLIDILPEIQEKDIVVLELSSFQLMTLTKSPEVSVITNISPNHLDIHKDYMEYINAKKKIYTYQNEDGIVILNYTNEVTKNIADDCAAQGKHVRLFSAHLHANNEFNPLAEGCGYVQGEDLVYFSSLYNYRLARNKLHIPGLHNAENLLTAITACAGVVSQEDIENTVSEFTGVEHRLEFVRELNGVKYFNSSIDSSPNRTMNALSVFDRNVVLIAGGKDKNIPYDAIGPVIVDKVKVLILTGPTAGKIEDAVKNAEQYNGENIKIFHFKSYDDAVQCAYSNSEPGDVVLLSPASTSFDMFRNFEERGNIFKALVLALE